MDRLKQWLQKQKEKLAFWRTFDNHPLKMRVKVEGANLIGMYGLSYNPIADMVKVRHSFNGYVIGTDYISRSEYLDFK